MDFSSVTSSPESPSTAQALVAARLSATALPTFPGQVPGDMAAAYRNQEEAIGLWPDRVAGWKVGYIAVPLQARLGAERLVGPIFSRRVQLASDQPSAFPVFEGGFGAIEGEFVMRLGVDAPADRTDWTAEDAMSVVEAVHVGVENAGSPFPGINEFGPTVTASDFGNNAGLILGPAIPDWSSYREDELALETFVDGVSVGRGTAASIPGGPASALAFLLNNLAARGRPARRGDLISTGAVTGIHRIAIGQSARVNFGAFGDIFCNAEMARPEPA